MRRQKRKKPKNGIANGKTHYWRRALRAVTGEVILPISIRMVPAFKSNIVKMSKSRCPMNHPTVFFKKQAILSVGGYSEDFGKLEDYKLWVDLLKSEHSLYNIQTVLVHMRIGNGFLKRRSNRAEIHDWDCLQQYLVKEKMISGFRAFLNKISIRLFIYMPLWMKKIIYKKRLRN